jgi:hypothetical protein
MENIQISIGQAKKNQSGFTSGVNNFFGQEKPNAVIGICTLLLISLAIGLAITKFGFSFGILALIAIVGAPSVYAIIAYPKFGITVLLCLSYVIMFIPRLGVSFPVGTIMDGLNALLILGFFLKQKFNPSWKIYKNPISVMILVWIGYNLLEVANPIAESRLAWAYTVRTVAVVMLLYFVLLYHLKDVKFIRFLFKVWIFLSFISAAYAFKQEFFGFTNFEQKWLDADPLIASLYFISGHWRKFSIFSDPVTFAYNMVISSILCFSLLTGPLPVWKKIVLTFLSLFFLLNMLYSGTRGAYVLLPAALGLFCILKFNKKVLLAGLVVAGILGAMIFTPTSNPSLQRFQSAFWPSHDKSYLVRKENQKRIQPYILTHPIGGGLGATGVWGQRFSPYSYLANFPPDSGYVRVAVELGWVGLLIFCVFMFIVLKTGITNYYKIKDPELKTYCLAMVLIVFALNIGNYPQEALVQYPTNVYFYFVIAMINATLFIDQKKNNPPQSLKK